MIPSTNKFFIEVDKSKEALLRDDKGNVIKGLNGIEMFQSLHWSPYEYAEQRGVIYAAPKEVFKLNDSRRKNNYDIKLEKGDIVYIHHFATHKDHSVEVDGIKMFMQDYEQIYAVERNGIIIPLEEYLFIEPDEETETDIIKGGIQIKPNKDFKPFFGKIAIINERTSRRFNLNVGDSILFESGSEYQMYINDKTLYRGKAHKVLCKVS